MRHGTYERQPRVVVGIDGSAGARAAADVAVREARLRGARLVAVIALGLSEVVHFDPYSVQRQPKAEIISRAKQKVASTLAGLDSGGLDVRIVVTTESPARSLIDHSTFADLLVVGSRGRGGFRGLVLGSVSLQCVLRARCPVTVVRSEPLGTDTEVSAAVAPPADEPAAVREPA